MPICYSFATSLFGKNVNRKEATTRAKEIQQLFKPAKEPADAHLCAFLDGDYQYLLRFKYNALFDVSRAILESSRRFSGMLGQTITMLEYPNKDAPKDGLKLNADIVSNRGIWLVQEHIDNKVGKLEYKGFGGARKLHDQIAAVLQLSPQDLSLACTDVFGPYDYVIEFLASRSKYDDAVKLLSKHKEIQSRIVRHEFLYCEPIDFKKS